MRGHAADLGVVRVVEVLVVKELGRKHDGRDDDPVHIELGQQEVVALDETVDVDEGEDEALGAESWRVGGRRAKIRLG